MTKDTPGMHLKQRIRLYRKPLQYKAINTLGFLCHYGPAYSKRAPKVFANSLPKSGTNLTKRVIGSFPSIRPLLTYHLENGPKWKKQLGKAVPGQMITAHCKYTEDTAESINGLGFQVVLTVRDPRDVAVSNAYYIAYMDRAHRLHPYFSSLGSDEERIAASIEGVDGSLLSDGERSKSIGEHVAGYLPWTREEGCLTVRFEDLVGEAGGGDEERQRETVRQLAQHLGVELSDTEVADISSRSFSTKSRTFRKGRSGAWREAFSEDHKRLFKKIAGEQLIELGYERGFGW